LDAARLKSIPLFEEIGDEELGQIAPFAAIDRVRSTLEERRAAS
jgi:hypothetical protein